MTTATKANYCGLTVQASDCAQRKLKRHRLLRSAKKFFRLKEERRRPLRMNGQSLPVGQSAIAQCGTQPQVYVVGSPNPQSPYLRIAHISDTCDSTDAGQSLIYQADVLVHSGNLAANQLSRRLFKCNEFHNRAKLINDYFGRMPHKYKIFVPGPSEAAAFDSLTLDRLRSLMPNCIVLRDSGCLIEGVSFYGMPASATRRTGAFGRSAGELRTAWSNVPDSVDVLISHSLPSNSLYEDLIGRLRPKMFLYGSRNQRSSRQEQSDESCVKFKDNIIFSNGHAGNVSRRGVFDFYAETSNRRTSLPEVPSAAAAGQSSASGSDARRCVLS